MSSSSIATRARLSFLSLLLSGSVAAHEIGHQHEHVEGGWKARAGFVSDVDVRARLWNPRGKSPEEIESRAAYVEAFVDQGRTEKERESDAGIRGRYADAVVINALMPSGIGIQGVGRADFERAVNRNRDAGVSLLSVSTWAFPGVNDVSFEDTLAKTTAAADELDVVRATSVADVRRAKTAGKMAMIYNTQGADYTIDDLDRVDWSRDQGILVMNFTYNNDNALAGGGQNPENNGVTEQGKAFIKRLNEQRIVVDVSHSSDQTAIDASKYSTRPVLASHSNVKAIYDQGRNLSDEAIRAIAATDGAVCTVGVGIFLNERGTASMEEIAEHVNYVGELVGRKHTCYASDYSYTLGAFLRKFIPDVENYPPENGFGAPNQNASGGDIWGVARVLEDKYRWPEDDIRGFLGENLLRVYAANWGK